MSRVVDVQRIPPENFVATKVAPHFPPVFVTSVGVAIQTARSHLQRPNALTLPRNRVDTVARKTLDIATRCCTIFLCLRTSRSGCRRPTRTSASLLSSDWRWLHTTHAHGTMFFFFFLLQHVSIWDVHPSSPQVPCAEWAGSYTRRLRPVLRCPAWIGKALPGGFKI